MNQDIKKLNIDKNFRKKLENLYTKNNHTSNSEIDSNDSNNSNNSNVNTQKYKKVDIKKTMQPQKNVFSNNLEEIHQICEKNTKQNTKQNIMITIEISSYYQLSQYIFFSIFSVFLSIRVMYILFLM